MFLKKVFSFFLVIFISTILVNNSYSLEPEEFVQQTVNYASEALNKDFTKEEKIKRLKKVAKEAVDIKGIAYYSLGKHRKNLSEKKKSRIP